MCSRRMPGIHADLALRAEGHPDLMLKWATGVRRTHYQRRQIDSHSRYGLCNSDGAILTRDKNFMDSDLEQTAVDQQYWVVVGGSATNAGIDFQKRVAALCFGCMLR